MMLNKEKLKILLSRMGSLAEITDYINIPEDIDNLVTIAIISGGFDSSPSASGSALGGGVGGAVGGAGGAAGGGGGGAG